MKQLTIEPKEAGNIIKFGKLPLLTRSLATMADMDNVVQIKVEGRYYAVELRPSSLEEALNELRNNAAWDKYIKEEVVEEEQPQPQNNNTSHYQTGLLRFNKLKEMSENGELDKCKDRLDICEKLGFERKINGTGYNWISTQIRKGYLEEDLLQYNKQNSGEYKYSLTGLEPNYTGNKHIRERISLKPVKTGQKLEDLGFVSLNQNLPSSKPRIRPYVKRNPRTPGLDYAGRPVERGNLSLWEWLNRDDYIVNKLFISDTGRPLIEKTVDYDDICLIFLNEGLPDRRSRNPAQKGKTAQNYTNVVIAQLLRKGILQKEEQEDGNKRYSLTLVKGGTYARGLYAVIQKGKYGWDPKSYRRIV